MTAVRVKSVLFDSDSRVRLAAQLAERASGRDAPLRWHELIDRFSREFAGRGVGATSMRHVLSGSARLLAWQPTREAMLAALGLGGLTYICWGFPDRGGWRDRRLAMVLRRATHILVNDETTRCEIAAKTGRDAQVVPFFIDMQYFAFRPLQGRNQFLFCNGVNDRDPELLLALAKRGYKIVWLANDDGLFRKYGGSHPNLALRRNVTYVELRDLYQTCRAKIMPAIHDAHCAGQTTGMEAISCGAPLLTSPGRSAGIFAGLPSVAVVQDNTPEGWDAALRSNSSHAGQIAAQTSRDRLSQRISTEAIARAFAPFFDWPRARFESEEGPTVA